MNGELHHLGAAFALDALDADEQDAFENHYVGCEICHREVVEFGEVAAVLAAAAAVEPPAGLRRSVMAEAASTRQRPPVIASSAAAERNRRRARRALAAVAAAAVVAVIAAIGLGGSTDRGDELAAVVGAPDAILTDLDGASGSLRVVWSPGQDRVAVLAAGLDDPGSGKVYELWLLGSDGATPAGLFSPVAGSVRAVLDVADIEPVGWGVTIEPEGGSAQPTTAVLYAGTT